MEFQQNAVAIRISREMALTYGMVEPSPEEAEAMAVAREKREARRQVAAIEMTVARAHLDGLSDPFARAVLDLHVPNERHECSACWRDDDHDDWPCETVLTIAKVADIPMPAESLWLVHL